jgi:prevent-host-death family protein
MRVTVHQAKTQLSKLIAAAEAGEEVIIARGDTPVVQLTPVRKPRKAGWLKGKVALDDSFWDPLPDEELRAWGLKD